MAAVYRDFIGPPLKGSRFEHPPENENVRIWRLLSVDETRQRLLLHSQEAWLRMYVPSLDT